MPNEITLSDKARQFPVKTQEALWELKTSPQQYYAALVPAKATDPLTDTTPTLAKIQSGLGESWALLAVSVAITELRNFFNVQSNMNEDQIALTAELIVETYWDLSLNDIKGVFRRKMKTAKLYGKLDGSDILGWLEEYKQECVASVQEQREREAREYEPSTHPITYEEWSKNKKPEENFFALEPKIGKPHRLTPEQQRQKDLDFFKFRTEYLISKGITPK